MEQSAPPQSLGARMKAYEHNTPSVLVAHTPYLIRLDGKKFSSFVRGFNRPADERIHKAMVATAEDLLQYMHATTAYTCSDEITLAFPLIKEEKDGKWVQKQHPYNGKRSKIESLIASRASVVFFKTLTELCATDPPRLALVHARLPHFDARVIQVPENYEIVNNVIWRMRDFRKNSISALADVHFSPKRLHGMHGDAKRALLKAERGIDWESAPLWTRTGTFVKRVHSEGGRSKLLAREMEESSTSDFAKNEAFILAPFWKDAVLSLEERKMASPQPFPVSTVTRTDDEDAEDAKAMADALGEIAKRGGQYVPFIEFDDHF